MIIEANPPRTLYRLAREPDPWAPPDWAYANDDGTFGNRFDDPLALYRVLYASSSRLGCFIETLARFRVDVELRAALAEIVGPDDHVPLGVVPREWCLGRAMGAADAAGVFAAIGTAESLATLRAALAAIVVRHGLDDLDAAAIRMSFPRAFTQAVSRHIYDSGRFDGVCYHSRYGDDIENWAVFEPFSTVHPRPPFESIDLIDPDLIAALTIHGLSVEEADRPDDGPP